MKTKHIADQFTLALFAPTVKAGAGVAESVTITPRYAVAKNEDGDTIKDKDGKSVLARDEAGNLIMSAQTLRVMPTKSEEGPCFANLYPDLKQAELGTMRRQAEDATLDMAIAKLLKARADGSHTFGNMRVSMKNGNMTLMAKSTKPVVQTQHLTDEAIVALCKARGLLTKEGKLKKDSTKAKSSKNTTIEAEEVK